MLFSGRYEIQPKGFIGRTTISGPKIKLNIQPDSTRAATVLLESAVDSNVYKAGSTLPGEITFCTNAVAVLNDARSPLVDWGSAYALVQITAGSCRGL